MAGRLMSLVHAGTHCKAGKSDSDTACRCMSAIAVHPHLHKRCTSIRACTHGARAYACFVRHRRLWLRWVLQSKFMAINLFKLSPSSLMSKLREGFLVCCNHVREGSLLYSNSPFLRHIFKRVNLNLNLAHPSPCFRVSPSLRLGSS